MRYKGVVDVPLWRKNTHGVGVTYPCTKTIGYPKCVNGLVAMHGCTGLLGRGDQGSDRACAETSRPNRILRPLLRTCDELVARVGSVLVTPRESSGVPQPPPPSLSSFFSGTTAVCFYPHAQ